MQFAPLPGPHGFGAALAGAPVAPEALAALADDSRDALLAALDAHSLVLLRTAGEATPEQLHAFCERLLGAGGLVDFSGLGADARNQGAGGPRCHAPGVPTVRVLGNTTDAGGAAASLLCRIGAFLGPQRPACTSVGSTCALRGGAALISRHVQATSGMPTAWAPACTVRCSA